MTPQPTGISLQGDANVRAELKLVNSQCCAKGKNVVEETVIVQERDGARNAALEAVFSLVSTERSHKFQCDRCPVATFFTCQAQEMQSSQILRPGRIVSGGNSS